ncbi:MAG: uroporphyrinogen decarboxylase family protein [Eubacteriales bacterium]|nr:uroporphyrinogen decarboxylase family protein [Eubacteriales bacterium]
MTDRQWDIIKRAAKCEKLDEIPVGMIVDSPWIPGYCGVSTIDFYTDRKTWMDCYKKIKADFPEAICLPDYWVEFGMASESGSFGCRTNFYDYQPACIQHLIEDVDDIEELELPDPDPETDGFMPIAINYYKHISAELKGTDEKIRMVAARGPLNIASFIMSVPEFCVAVKTNPDELHEILEKTTALVIKWLKAQMNVLDDVEGILVLDDICGFLGEADYLEFAHPYLKRIFDAFDVPVKMFHNDNFGNQYVTFPYIADLGINIFNFSNGADIVKARELLGDKVCILGNVAPRDILTAGTPEDVERAVFDQLDRYGSHSGLILSAGGGASPGMGYENYRAFIDACAKWNEAHKAG